MRSLFRYEPMFSRRVDCVLMLTIIGGTALSLLVRPSEFWFFDLWIGGALAMPLGLLFGILWERSQPEHDAMPFSKIAFPAVISVILACAAAYQVFRTSTTKERIAELRGLPEDSLRQIDIYEPFGDRHIRTIVNRDELSSFVRAVRDARIASPDKRRSREPIRRNWFRLTLEDGRQIWLNVEGGSGMFIGITRNGGSVTMTNNGDFRSVGLAAWVTEQGLRRAR